LNDQDTFHQGQSERLFTLALGWRGAFHTLLLFAGPYDSFPGVDKMFGVCVRSERVKVGNQNVHLPIADFSVPQNDLQVQSALVETFRAVLDGKPVYVGCMGGFGRTGLFLALMAKAAGIPDPVPYVRDTYYPNAVETREQLRYVENFDVRAIRKWLYRAAWINRIKGKRAYTG
jgi:hypothetical protein